MSTTKVKADAVEAARQELRSLLSPGDVVYVLQRHVARSGMTRWLDLYINGVQYRITETAAVAMGERTYLHDGLWTLKVGGCGMDMHFATVYSLSRSLWPDGVPCTGVRGCTSSDHSNDYNAFAREYDTSREDCQHVPDGVDTDGTEWFRCTVHDCLTIGETWCEGHRGAPMGDEHVARQTYISERIATSYDVNRVHPDGGYALNYRTI